MIFLTAEQLKTKQDKNDFIEIVNLYIKTVENICSKYNDVLLSSSINNDICNELIRIGFISSSQGLKELSTALGDSYVRLLNSVAYSLANSDKIGASLDKIDNSKRLTMQADFDKRNLRIADFFCGAGGLSLGFIQEGFNVALANDIDDDCIKTYIYNHPEIPPEKIICGDLKKIVDNIEEYISGDIDVVVGGPPCQGFSEANRQRVIDDPRNELYKYYIGAVKKIVPKIVVMENVKGMLGVANQVVEDYESILATKNGVTYTYKASYQVLNSQYYNVAQSRERLIYIAVRNDVEEERGITPKIIFDNLLVKKDSAEIFKLHDALEYIKPLEAPRIKHQNEVDSDITGKKVDINNYGNSNRYLEIINNNRSIPLVYNHKARFVSDINYEIYKKLNQGDDATDDKIKDIMPYAHRNHCFKDKYYKLIDDRPSRTITAHLRMDCHSHIHPNQIRAITPREAARVQSFPDDYVFLGPYLKTYMQIGNAVPVQMSKAIALEIKKYLL